ncbi:MAG: ABC transporter substrate-binding protein [Lachnospiraceae bacterium]|nr:ABC transporter substrate-binding protein [Lachnospiraceae bacterium]
MKKMLSCTLALMMVVSMLAGCSGQAATTAATTAGVTAAAATEAATTAAPVTAAAPETTAAPETAAAPATTAAPSEPATQVFTDSAGRTVELPYNITKISPSGALAQIFLVAIAPDLLASKASEYKGDSAKYIDKSLSQLPTVGQFYGSDDLNYESIAAIAPEVVIDVGQPMATIVEDMDSITEKLAIPAIHLTADLRNAPDVFRTLGKLLHREEKGEELAKFIEKTLAKTDSILEQVGEDNKTKALYLTGDAGLNVIAKTSYHAEIFDYIADNIAVVDQPASKGTGNETDLEQISLWDPDVIFFYYDSVYDTVKDDPTWSHLKAISTGKYYKVPMGPYNWFGTPPSIQRYLFLLFAAKILYPEYADYDLQAEVTEYYKLFYGYDMSDADYKALVNTDDAK